MPMSVASESFWESTFIDQNNPKRQTAGPHWGLTGMGLLGLAYHDARRPCTASTPMGHRGYH